MLALFEAPSSAAIPRPQASPTHAPWGSVHFKAAGSITGHKDYESMKPYIEIANDTNRREMDKWNGKKLKNDIIEAMDKLEEDKLNKVYEYILDLKQASMASTYTNRLINGQ